MQQATGTALSHCLQREAKCKRMAMKCANFYNQIAFPFTSSSAQSLAKK
jgi:hypothetical protein